jgi:hypothetical protein
VPVLLGIPDAQQPWMQLQAALGRTLAGPARAKGYRAGTEVGQQGRVLRLRDLHERLDRLADNHNIRPRDRRRGMAEPDADLRGCAPEIDPDMLALDSNVPARWVVMVPIFDPCKAGIQAYTQEMQILPVSKVKDI